MLNILVGLSKMQWFGIGLAAVLAILACIIAVRLYRIYRNVDDIINDL